MIIIHGLTNSGKDTLYKHISEYFSWRCLFKNIKMSAIGKELIIKALPTTGLELDTYDDYKPTITDVGLTYKELAERSNCIRQIHPDLPIIYALRNIDRESCLYTDPNGTKAVPILTDLRSLSEIKFLLSQFNHENIFHISLYSGYTVDGVDNNYFDVCRILEQQIYKHYDFEKCNSYEQYKSEINNQLVSPEMCDLGYLLGEHIDSLFS